MSSDIIREVQMKLSIQDKVKMEEILYDVSSTLAFSSFAEKLLFEAAFRKGFVAHHLEKIK